MLHKTILYLKTIRYLKPSQIYYRVARRLARLIFPIPKPISSSVPSYRLGKYLIPELDFSSTYLSRFNVEELMNDTFTFLNIKEEISLESNWNLSPLQRLWRFNFHYFEYLFPIGHEFKKTKDEKYYNKFKYWVINWIRLNNRPSKDSWDPYTVSLRLANWILGFEIFYEMISKDKDFKNTFLKSIYAHYLYLQKNTERDILGNHYIENLKALILGSIFFVQNNSLELYLREWEIQLDEQILDDGMHFELSPMYHKIVLEALMRVNYWCPHSKTKKKIEKMISVIYSLEKDMGKMPFFNDCAENIAKDTDDMLSLAKEYFSIKPNYVCSLEASGYYILETDNKKCIIDAGQIGPKYQPGHGHCDALSYELSVRGKPVIVNSGTYGYEKGKVRDFFRSTRAHNTVMIDDIEQSECWGSFRVADRMKRVSGEVFSVKGMPFFVGSGISSSGDIHTRRMTWVDNNLLLVLESTENQSQQSIKSYIHIHPDLTIRKDEHWRIVRDSNIEASVISIFSDCQALYHGAVENGWYSPQFGVKVKNYVLELQCSSAQTYFGYMLIFDDQPVSADFSKKQIWITHGDSAKVINIY